MKITKAVIAKVGADQAKEYTKFEDKPISYGELLNAFQRDGMPSGEAEVYLWEKQEIGKDDSLADYVTAGDYALMINDIIYHNAEPVDVTEFQKTFDEWFCIEFEELLTDYGIDLDALVDVDAMEQMAAREQK